VADTFLSPIQLTLARREPARRSGSCALHVAALLATLTGITATAQAVPDPIEGSQATALTATPSAPAPLRFMRMAAPRPLSSAGFLSSTETYDPRSTPTQPTDAQAAATVPAAPQSTHTSRSGYDLNGDPLPVGGRWSGSTYIPVDSWMYPALLRLYSFGYLNTAFIALRPWTRLSVLHMLDQSQSDIRFDNNEEAVEILDKLYYELRDEPTTNGTKKRGLVYGLSSAYVGARVVGGTVLRNSWHLGQTFNNDYGRPYSNGFNSYNGFSTVSEWGPFSLHVRGEFQHAPSYEGYSFAVSSQLATLDGINYGSTTRNAFGGTNRPTDTIPEGPIASVNRFHLLEANLSAHMLNHEISFGKSDSWLGPGLGGAMAWSNNADNIYSFRINRIEPLHIPYVSWLLGDIRYDFMIGSLKGHTYPNAPYAHTEKIDFAPTKNFQYGFQRTIVWGGKGHQPVTLHTFLNGFFDINDTTLAEKLSREDPGARFSTFTFSYRLPFLRRLATLYADSTTHDDVFPISAPRRAGWRPGIYLTRLPYAPKLDLRVEGTYTDYVTSRSVTGKGNYYEIIQRQAYTNSGFIFGDWIGREAKGGQAWLTYHLSGNESVQFQYLRKKNGSDFPAGGTTQNIYRVDVIKRLRRDVELNAWFQVERWKAPIWKTGQQGSTTGAFTVTWYPRLKSSAQ
jgi:hypothetical protein